MAVAIKRLFGPAQLTNAAATKYTVPSSTKTIIRMMHWFNQTDSTHVITWSIGSDAAGVRLYDSFSLGARQPYTWNCYLPMDAAEILQAFADAGSSINMTITGDEITL